MARARAAAPKPKNEPKPDPREQDPPDDQDPADPPDDELIEGERPAEGDPEDPEGADPEERDDDPLTMTRGDLRKLLAEAAGQQQQRRPRRHAQRRPATNGNGYDQLSREQLERRTTSYQALRQSEDAAHQALADLMEDMARIDRRNREADQLSEVHPKLRDAARQYMRSGHARTFEAAVKMARGDYFERRYKKLKSKAGETTRERRQAERDLDLDNGGDRRHAQRDGRQQPRTRLGTFTRTMTQREAVEAGVTVAPRAAIQRVFEAPERADRHNIDALMEKAAVTAGRLKRGRLRPGR